MGAPPGGTVPQAPGTQHMITLVTDDDIAALGHAFLARTLPKSAWTHAAHFAAALHMIETLGPNGAARAMPAAIRAYNEAAGVANTDTGGYHDTITHASLAAAAAAPGASPAARLRHLLAGPCGKSAWLGPYWSRAVLFTPRARRAWVPPDLLPLPFPAPIPTRQA